MVMSIRRIAESDVAVRQVKKLLTMHFGPHQVLVTLDIQFHDALSASALIGAIERVERRIRFQHSDVRSVFIEAQAVTDAHQNENSNRAERHSPQTTVENAD